jgi:hypothetical protein
VTRGGGGGGVCVCACGLSCEQAALVYGYVDLIAAIVFIVSYMWLRMFERTEASAVDRLSITISDYTVQVSRIPEVSL